MHKMRDVEKCPAFEESCPYKDVSQEISEAASKCPAFEDGCPFRELEKSDDIYKKMKEVPADHFEFEFFKQTLEHMHSENNKYEELLAKCPHFQEGCPFKTLCADGTPLVLLLERYVKNRRSEITPEIESILLSKELKSGTKVAHTRAESTHFVTEFVKGNVDESMYALYISQLYFIYDALEKSCERLKDHEHLKVVNYAELARTKTLKRDLIYYLGHEWQNEARLLGSTKKYVDRISECDGDELLAHHYTRYLGDLSGGQILKKKAIRHYGLPNDGSGVQFYDFSDINNLHEFKQMYRAALDDLRLTPDVANKIVQEAVISFDFNTDIFLELDQELGLLPKPVVTKPPEASADCPFGFKAKENGLKGKAYTPTTSSNIWILSFGFILIAYAMWRFADD